MIARGLLLLFLAFGAAGGAGAGDGPGRTPQPVIERAIKGAQCVADPSLMRRSHMDFLKHQRDDTVRGGIRGAKYSLKACIECHAGKQTASVAQSESNFCVSCHRYAAVKIDCFECHTPRAAARVAANAGARP